MSFDRRTPPYSLEAEESVLGAALLDEKVATKIVRMLKQEYFYIPRNQKIFRGVVALLDKNVVPDLVTVTNWLKENNILDEVGGSEYISKLVTGVLTTANFEHYVRIIFDKAMKRNVIKIATDMLNKGYADEDEVVEIVTHGENEIQALKQSNEMFFDSGVVNIFELGDEVIKNYERIKSGRVGILTPWETMNEITLGFQPEDLCFLCGRISIGKCVRKETLIIVNGELTEIGKLPYNNDGGFAVFGGKVYGMDKETVAPMMWYQKKQRCIKVKTSLGFEVSGTEEHPLKCFDNGFKWKKIRDIVVGDRVVIKMGGVKPGGDIEFGRLLGYLIGDGCLSLKKNAFEFSNTDEDIVEWMKKVLKKRYNVDMHKRKDNNCDYYWSSKEMKRHLIKCGVGMCKSKDKEIPQAVLSGGEETLWGFVMGLIETDGYIGDHIMFYTSSEKLAKQMHVVLAALGVLSKVSDKYVRYKNRKVKTWAVYIPKESIFKNYSKFRFVSSRKKKLFDRIKESRRKVGSYNMPVNKEANVLYKDMFGYRSRFKREIAKFVNERGRLRSGNLSRNRIVEFILLCEKFKSVFDSALFRDFQRIASDDTLFIDSVVEVVDDGVHDVFDVSMVEDHSFVSNGIVSHNTQMLLLLARAAWEAKHRTLIVSSEVARERIFLRLLAMLLNFPYKQLRSAQLSEFQEKELYEGIMRLKTGFPLYVTGGNFDIEINAIRRAVEYIQPEIVFIDGINLVKGEGESRFEKSSNVADECKRIAKKYQIPIIASAQFNREVKQNATRAELTQIAESDSFGRNADYVFAVLQDSDLRMQKRLKVSVLKARESEDLKDFYVNWDWNTQKFDEIIETDIDSDDNYTPF